MSASLRSSPARLLSTLLAAVLLAPAAGVAADAAPAPAQKKVPIVLAAPRDLAAATEAVEKATGARGEKLPFGDVPLAEGRSFEVDHVVAERLIDGSHATFKKAGLYLFRYERSYGMPGEKDHVGLLKTVDHRAVIRRVGTAQGHRGMTTEKVVAWLDALAKDEPFEISEVGADYVAGQFERTPKDPAGVARRCAEIAPDLVAARASNIDLLAEEIRVNRTLYLIW